ncbi:MAG: fibronectin type III domain-containing protein, partial [Sediminibacterium sp.]|nr:fibronectin type III domain-containing protein [Sediminibacterium sp.]
NSYTFDSVISNQSIRAIFRVRRFTITASAGIGGSISPSGNIIVDYGTNQPFIITANYGYIIDTILINGNKVNSVTNYTFNSVTSNQTIYAAFKAITKPSKPINVQASPGNAQATISFNSPLDNGSVPIVKYIVQVVGGTIKDSINTNLSSNNSITIKGLLNGVSYIFSVIAVNSFGLASDTALSNTVVTNANLRNISTETKNGTITSATAIIAGNNIQITYAPNQGYTLDSIFINNNYSSRITLDSMNSYTFYNVMGDSSIKVVYKIKTYTISASAGNNGSISPVGISTVEYGTRPMYTITANTGFVIDSLLINGVKVTNVYSYIFDSIKTDQIIRVTFKIQTFTINAFAGSGGSINSAGITTVNYGARPTYTITAKMGYEVDSLLINGVKITNVDSYTFDSIKSDQTITVTFKLITFTITASAGNGGTISPSGITMVDYGTRPTYTIKANSGFEIDSLLLNDVKITNVTNYIFDSIKSNQTIRVTFKLQTFTIVANAGSAGSINPSGIITVNYGTRPSFTITANTGYEIDSLLLNDVQITNVTNYVFDSIKSNQTIRVTFKVQTFTIMASAGNGGVIKPAGITTVNYGDRPTYSIIANYGYVLDSLLVNGINKMINDTNYTFDSVISNQTIYATFKEITNPSKPLNIEAFPGNAQATISFSSPLDNGGVPVVKYIVQVEGGPRKDSINTTASTARLTIKGLLNGVSYRFSVRAVNSFGLASDTALSNFVLLDSNLRNINTEITNGTITKDTSVIFGNNVRITYKPNEGYILDSIFINNSYSGRITLDSMNSYTFYNILADSSIKVKNKIQTFTITASAGSNGVISPSGVTTVNYGARPTYTIAANTGYVIDNLLINGVKINNISRYTFNSIKSDQTISVTFKVQTFTITASAGIGGTISPSGVDIVNYGTRPTYTITANTGYEIASLFINGIKVNNVGNYTFDSIKSNQTIGVTFKIQTFTISATVKNGTISPSGINVYNFGSSQMFTFSPTNPNYVLDSLVIDGVLQANYVNNSYTFNGIQQNHSIYVVYLQKYTINISSNIGGVVTPATNQQVQIGASLRVSWVVNQGYLLDSVLINGVRNTDSLNSYTFTNIQANQSIRVVFKQKTVLPNNNFNIAVTQPNCVLSSGTLQITANVLEYYKISIQAANGTNIIDSFRGLTYSRMLTDTGLYKLSITLVDTMFTNLNRYFEFIVKYPKAITAYSEIESQER